ncbi:uncharacterized protein MEPE_02476 [Melanopsichium pennsylvanicum]|uniref:Uncharacterized protein n=2 Tax=Melanopsichium pennsylvanicum TaxID=63383 RepID=A0AAJ4XMI2_9BASI|nr:putative protein [Melanopsichium pennsylvanicum 4]SNX83768.1 uncharacterized protein MEPE_02476 [Melanopsichium pennsylvanicum]
MASTEVLGLGVGIGIGLPLIDKLSLNDNLPKSANFEFHGLPTIHPQLRWPYCTRHRSSTISSFGGYDSSPTPSDNSSPSSSSESEATGRVRGHGVLLSYFSPAFSDTCSEEDGADTKKVYLLSKGLKQPANHRRCKSETFRFPLPPAKEARSTIGPLKSALRSNSKSFSMRTASVSPPPRPVSASWRRSQASKTLSPAMEEDVDVEEKGRQGWSPYSSHAPTPRQASGQQRFSALFTTSSLPSETELQPPSYNRATFVSPPSSTSSHTLVSDGEMDSGAETDPTFSSDAAKLARLHASLFLLDNRVSELPLSLGDDKSAKMGKVELGGSVEEKMAYLCGLGYRYRKTSKRHARKGSSDFVMQHVQSADVGGAWSESDSDQEKIVTAALAVQEEGLRQGKVQSFEPELTQKTVRVVSNTASSVTSSCSSPILAGLLSASARKIGGGEDEEDDGNGDETIKPRELLLPTLTFEPDTLFGEEFSYLVKNSLLDARDVESRDVAAKQQVVRETGLFTPALTTPELGLDGESPLLLDRWPTPPQPAKSFNVTLQSGNPEGCRPFSSTSSIDPFPFALSPRTESNEPILTISVSCPASVRTSTTLHHQKPQIDDVEEESSMVAKIAHASRTIISPSTISVLTRPRPLRSSNSNNSLYSSASPDKFHKPVGVGFVLSRPRPVPSRAKGDGGLFAHKPAHFPRSKTSTSLQIKSQLKVSGGGLPKSVSTSTIVSPPRNAGSAKLPIKVPQRKSSLDVRAEAEMHKLREESIPHPNSISRDPEVCKQYHSSASPYLRSPFSTLAPSHSYSTDAIQTESLGNVIRSAASVAKLRRGKNKGEMIKTGMTKSLSLPVLFTARTPAQRLAGDTGMPNSRDASKRKSVVFVGENKEGGKVVTPPKEGVLIVQEQVVTHMGLAL